ncbi:MAG: hypothetical protein C5B60_03240 [Chloroflexi bacterium]|nr:MAG: hypothetical protein C5B60_03240 [Chloroflexota bacterium]
MGKLVEKLHQVGQGSGGGFGFAGRAAASPRKPRPAAVLITLNSADTAGAEAAAKAGVDGVLIAGWTPGADIGQLKSALVASGTLWGVEYAGGPARDGVLPAAVAEGAAFVVIGPSAPAAVLFDEVEQLDLVVTIETPKDDLSLLLVRSENLLPAQAALVSLTRDASSLGKLTVTEFARQRWVFETLRFPALVMLKEAPQADAVRTLVRLGIDGLIIAGTGAKPETLAKQVQVLGEMLEALPAQKSQRGSVAIGGFMTGSGESAPGPGRPGRPAPEPDEE